LQWKVTGQQKIDHVKFTEDQKRNILDLDEFNMMFKDVFRLNRKNINQKIRIETYWMVFRFFWDSVEDSAAFFSG
jgi:hypothetical protein